MKILPITPTTPTHIIELNYDDRNEAILAWVRSKGFEPCVQPHDLTTSSKCGIFYEIPCTKIEVPK